MKRYLFAAAVLALAGAASAGERNAMEKRFEAFLRGHLETVRPLFKKSALAHWRAANTGKSEDYRAAGDLNLRIRQVYSDREDFAFIKEARESGQVADPLLARQLDDLYRSYLPNQIDAELTKQIVELGTQIDEKFSTFRGSIDGRKVTSNDIDDILKESTDNALREKAWLASKQVGPVVAEDIRRLVKLRNQAARSVGFDNFHTMSLALSEQNVDDIRELFAELRDLTEEPFTQAKARIDAKLAEMYGVPVDQLRPWHYHDPFFQQAPQVLNLDLDQYYEGRDIAALGAGFYRDIGLPVDDVLSNSDLYEREGKNPHAFCTDIDHEGDVRILCNVRDDERWMGTTLHELGHAVYAKFNDPDVPYLLRHPAHIFATEAIAMLFGRLSSDPDWMAQMLDLTPEQRSNIAAVSGPHMRNNQLVFARWDMVMFEFERRMYADPDQDLNGLWWSLVKEHQHVSPPPGRDEPDWASKIHIATSPCYYHNYLLGELLASQLHRHIVAGVLDRDSDYGPTYVGEKAVGRYLREKVFAPGAVYPWNEMIERATGRPLTPEYFVEQFVR